MSVTKDAASIRPITLNDFGIDGDRQRRTQPVISHQSLCVTAAQELDRFE